MRTALRSVTDARRALEWTRAEEVAGALAQCEHAIAALRERLDESSLKLGQALDTAAELAARLGARPPPGECAGGSRARRCR